MHLQHIGSSGFRWLFMSRDESSYKANEKHHQVISDEQDGGSQRKHEELATRLVAQGLEVLRRNLVEVAYAFSSSTRFSPWKTWPPVALAIC